MELTTDLIETAETEYTNKRAPVRGIRERIAADTPLTEAERELIERRKRMIAATTVEPLDRALERYLGGNDLLPINYLMIGILQSRAVGRIRFIDQHVGREVLATGFLISEDLMMTNHHVFFPTPAAAAEAAAEAAMPALARLIASSRTRRSNSTTSAISTETCSPRCVSRSTPIDSFMPTKTWT